MPPLMPVQYVTPQLDMAQLQYLAQCIVQSQQQMQHQQQLDQSFNSFQVPPPAPRTNFETPLQKTRSQHSST